MSGARLEPGALLPVRDALALLPLPRATFYRLVGAGTIEVVRVPTGKRVRLLVVRSSLEQYVAGLRAPARQVEASTVDAILAKVTTEHDGA